MTPEQKAKIDQLLAQAKAAGLSGGTLADLKHMGAAYQKDPAAVNAAIQRGNVAMDLKEQAITGLQPTLGPANFLLPAGGLLMQGAPAAITIGQTIGNTINRGYLSNEDGVNLALLGLMGGPLLGRKGQGKLYSRLVEDLDSANADKMTPTFLNRFLKKGNYKPEEIKALNPNALATVEGFSAPSSSELADSMLKRHVNEKELTGKYDLGGGIRATPENTAYSNITFPEILDKLDKHGVMPYDHRQSMAYRNIIMQTPYDVMTNPAASSDHWSGQGNMHSRIALNSELPDKHVGIIAEVQSDALKKFEAADMAKTTFINDYPNIATRQSLLELIQGAHATDPNKSLQIVWPSGKLQQEVNRSTSNSYDKIYDKRVTKAVSEALGDGTIIESMQEAPFTPIKIKSTVTGDAQSFDEFVQHKIQTDPDYANALRDPFSGDARDAMDELKIEWHMYMYDPKSKPVYNVGPDTKKILVDEDWKTAERNAKLAADSLTGATGDVDWTFALTGDDASRYFNLRAEIENMHQVDIAKKKASTINQPPVDLFSTTIQPDKISRLAKEGLPLWMLPIGVGMAGMKYNDNSTKQSQPTIP